MAQIRGEIVIARPVETVFDFVADQCNEPLYNSEMVSAAKVGEEPIGVGTRFRSVVRSSGREVPVDIEFTAFERPTRLGSHSSAGGMTMDGVLEFRPLGASTQMTWVWDVRPSGAMRLISPLVTWMGKRQEQRIWTALKRYLET